MKLSGNDRVAGEEAVDPSRPRVARIASVADQDAAAASAEEESCAEAGRTSADDDDVISFVGMQSSVGWTPAREVSQL